MCISTIKYPLFLNKETGKKKIFFHLGVDVRSMDDYHRLDYFKSQFRLACNGMSLDTTANNELKGEQWEFIDLKSVPCGICEECLKGQSRDWASRIMLEASNHEYNYFVTLTYDDEHLPSNGMLVPDDLSQFNKNLKAALTYRNMKSDFRFYGVGEYGSHTLRPHYHSIMFGLELKDLKFYKTTPNGDILYTSPLLDQVWQKGFVTVGAVSVGSACYVARYCDKKKRLTALQKRELKDKGIVPEFSRMSRRPGIAASFTDYVVDRVNKSLPYIQLPNGQRNNLPMYFVKKIKEMDDTDFVDWFNKQRDIRSNIALQNNIIGAEMVDMDALDYNLENDKLLRVKKRGN